MLWRSLSLLAWPAKPRPSIARLDLQQRHPARHSSALSSSPSIAIILATPSVATDSIITAVGLVRTVRNQKQITFVELEDGSTPESLQAILKPKQAEGLGTGASVALTGRWQPAPKGADQGYELEAEEVTILGGTTETYPIQKKYHSPEYLRTIPHLRLRTSLNAVLARMRSEADHHVSSFFRKQQFVRLQPPIITSSDCEGAGEVFSVSTNPSAHDPSKEDAIDKERDHFFKSPKYLTVSSQLHLEAFVHEHPKVWTLSPTFRAEKSDTPRHVSEFWMLEAELRAETLEDIMDLVENMIRALVIGLQNSSILADLDLARQKSNRSIESEESSSMNGRWERLLRPSWPRITYADAVERLQYAFKADKTTFHHEPSWEAGLQLEHEKWIASEVGLGSPVFVTHYPQKIKPFYMLPSPQVEQSLDANRQTVECFDLLLPESCEIVGGSLREHRPDNLVQTMKHRGMSVSDTKSIDNPERYGAGASPAGPNVPADSTPSSEPSNLDWYVDLRRYGSIPHGGFGLGFDRLLGYLAGVNNIKDVVPWPRYYGRCDC